MTINVLKVLHDTTVDGPGFRTSIYCAGCRHRCPDCHNPQSWEFGSGDEVTTQALLDDILADPFADVTFTGGDPLYQAEAFAELASLIRKASSKTIWCYTGFLFEQLLKDKASTNLLSHLDVLVDGPFLKEHKDEDILFRGSTNQRIISVPESLQAGHAILWQEPKWEV